jgi:hypothetical protein
MISFERLPGESTAGFLGRILDRIELHEMAERARLFHFDDYFCPTNVDDGMNLNRLVNELIYQAQSANSEQKKNIGLLIEEVKNGTFDGTKEESDAWAQSEDGQQTFRELVEGKRHGKSPSQFDC